MAKLIIPFIPRICREAAKENRTQKLVNAAWKLAHCALWPEQTISPFEDESVREYITEYFNAASNAQRAFKAMIQRIILTRNYIQSGQERYVNMPSVWFNKQYPFGFVGTLAWLRKVEVRRKDVPGYLAHIEEFAHQYYKYAVTPTDSNVGKCREVLLTHHADSLLQIFYSTLVHIQNIRA